MQACLKDNLINDLGPIVMDALQEPDITEIISTFRGNLLLDSHEKGLFQAGVMEKDTANSILLLMANHLGTVLDKDNSRLEGEFPLNKGRFAGLYSPVVSQPMFTIRKPADRIFTVQEYVEAGIITQEVKKIIKQAILERKNIVVTGGTKSGKTTLTNAIIDFISILCPQHRMITMEDTYELQCNSPFVDMLHTSKSENMQDLLKITLRLRPDRIIIGEVRDKMALDMLKAWNTGHPGGVCTYHADDAYSSLLRLEELIRESSISPMPTLIQRAVDIIIFIECVREKRSVTEVAEVTGYANNEYQLNYLYKKEAA